MKVGNSCRVLVLFLVVSAVSSLLAVPVPAAHAIASSPDGAPLATSSPTPTLTTTGSSWIKLYGNVVANGQLDVYPEDVQATSDGGYIALAASKTSAGPLVGWLVKLDASGSPQWQTEVGCVSTPPGSYTIGVSLQQTTDGGYVLGGGTIGCGSKGSCPSLSGVTCAWVAKLDAGGKVRWANAYSAGYSTSSLTEIRQTTDGGYVAVGSADTPAFSNGALILKLDGRGGVQWQRRLGPAGSTNAYFNAVEQTSDGGYVGAGELYGPGGPNPIPGVLVVKLDSNGNVRWQKAYNNFDSNGVPTGSQHVKSVVQTSDGGYLVAGGWSNNLNTGAPQGEDALLLKLDSNGNVQWQRAYDGGVHCFFNGYSEVCTHVGGTVYVVHPTADGGYFLAGSTRQIFSDSTPLVPWLAKTDSAGNLLWQYLYYAVYAPTGRSLSEYFASATLAKDGGFLALGYTEIYELQTTDLYVVKTDGAGFVAGCSEVHTAPPLIATNPGLISFTPSLPVETAMSTGANSPSKMVTTSIAIRQDC